MFALLLSIITIATLTLVEFAIPARPVPGERFRNLQVAALGVANQWYLVPLFALPFPYHLIDARAWPFWTGFPLFLIVMDLGEYLFHRAQHRIPALWAMHTLHHSDSNMTATTTWRHFWGDVIVKSLTIWPLAYFIIAPSGPVVIAYALIGFWNFVGHSNVPLDFGKLSWLLNSPAYHRRHHSSEPEHFGSNYAALLPIWDVISGSYRRPDGFPPTGLDVARPSFVQALVWPLRSVRIQRPWRSRGSA